MSDEEAKLPAVRERTPVTSNVSIMDTAKFDHLGRVARIMASAGLMPESLTHVGAKNARTPLPDEVVVARAFLIAAQADRWEMDPTAVMGCCSLVHNKLMYEGKLVNAVIEARTGIRLKFEFGKWDPKTLRVQIGIEAADELLGVVVSGTIPGETEVRSVEGFVGAWRTTGDNSPWTAPANWRRQLRYRGSREWANAHEPGVVLGVLTDDDVDYVEAPQRLTDERGLDEAFGKAAAKPATKAPPAATKKDEGATGEGKKAPAAPAAETARDTKASATDASGGSAAATSGQQRPSDPLLDGANNSTRAEADKARSDRPGAPSGRTDEPRQATASDVSTDRPGVETGSTLTVVEDAGGTVVDFPGDRKAPEVKTEGKDEVDQAAFNTYAQKVMAETAWDPIKSLVGFTRNAAFFKAAPEALRRQALLVAYNRVLDLGLAIEDGDVAFYRLWLLTVDESRRGEVRPRFRKLMRGGHYDELDADEKNIVVGETNTATGD